MTATLTRLQLRAERDVVLARRRTRQISALLGFEAPEQTRIATAVSEIARNAHRYAGGGVIEFQVDEALHIRIADRGPGIENLSDVLQGRFRPEPGSGLGILSARRLMDRFHVESEPGKGTTVILSKNLPKRVKLTREALSRISDQLARSGVEDPYEELDLQNRELLHTLADLRNRQEELGHLNRELEDTNRGVVALYNELDEKAEHLRQADRLKSTFLSHMSHEFRTPLNSVMALSKILLDRLDGPLTEEQAKQVSFIHAAAHELTEMVNDLLDLAKVEAGKVEVHVSEFDIATLLGTMRGMMRPLSVNPDVQLVFEDVDPRIPHMFSDEGKVSQIIRNFVSNAIKFTDLGEIRISCAYEPSTGFAVFRVADTGMGIAPEDQEHIFQQYYQVDSPRQRKVRGTGLGLPLSKKLAELLGGSIQLKSAVGAGSEFSVRLPIRLPVASAADPIQQERRPRILVIDDDETARYLIRKQLTAIEVYIEEAGSGDDGLRLAREHGADVIVLDLTMQDTSGYQVLAELREEPATAAIPVVVHTSLSMGPEEHGSLAHAAAIVDKARSEPELRDAVSAILARVT